MQKDKVISRRKVIVRTESDDENKYIYLFFFVINNLLHRAQWQSMPTKYYL